METNLLNSEISEKPFESVFKQDFVDINRVLSKLFFKDTVLAVDPRNKPDYINEQTLDVLMGDWSGFDNEQIELCFDNEQIELFFENKNTDDLPSIPTCCSLSSILNQNYDLGGNIANFKLDGNELVKVRINLLEEFVNVKRTMHNERSFSDSFYFLNQLFKKNELSRIYSELLFNIVNYKNPLIDKVGLNTTIELKIDKVDYADLDVLMEVELIPKLNPDRPELSSEQQAINDLFNKVCSNKVFQNLLLDNVIRSKQKLINDYMGEPHYPFNEINLIDNNQYFKLTGCLDFYINHKSNLVVSYQYNAKDILEQYNDNEEWLIAIPK